MMKPLHYVLLVTLLVDGGVRAASPGSTGRDGGSVPVRDGSVTPAGTLAAPLPGSSGTDGGALVSYPSDAGADSGSAVRSPIIAEGMEWPDEVHPVATLDGPAVLAAHAALQRLLASFPSEYAKDCSYTAKAMEVKVGKHGGLYFVEINRRLEQCGWAAPGFNPSPHWVELYAVSPEGKVLARYPYHP